MVQNNRSFCLLLVSIIVFAFSTQVAFSQLNEYGYPFSRNYTGKEIQYPGMNLAVVMNSKGVLYFANMLKGVIEYDGISWKQIAIKNSLQCRSLAIDSNDVVFVGSVGEIGYIAPNKTGSSKYFSLTHLIDTSKYHFNVIWKTYATPRGVFFCSVTHIFQFQFPDSINVIELPKEAFFSFYLDDKLVNGYYKKGLIELSRNSIVDIKGVDPLIDHDIRQILPYGKNKWLVYASSGLHLYDKIAGKVELLEEYGFDKRTNQILSKYYIYNGCVIPNKGYSITTLDNGLFIGDDKLTLTDHFATKTGLQSSTISDILYNKNQGVLWATLDNGVSRIEFNSPIKVFSKESNLSSSVLSAISHNNELYVGTFSGLFYQAFNDDELPWFNEIDNLQGKFVYTLASITVSDENNKLVAGSTDGYYEISGKTAIKINSSEITPYCTYVSKKHKNTFYGGCTQGVYRISWANNKWTVNKITKFGKDFYSLFEDANGDVWASSGIDGIFRITKGDSICIYTTKDGLPSNSDLRVYFYEKANRVLVCSGKGIYEFNSTNNKFEPSRLFDLSTNFKSSQISSIYEGYNGAIWLYRNNRLIKLTPKNSGFEVDSTTLKRLPEVTPESFYNDKNGITWICSSEGLYSYNNLFADSTNKTFYTLIRSVTSNDSLIFGGNFFKSRIIGSDTIAIPSGEQTDELKPVLKYRNNNLTFTFSSPYFQDESANQFSYILEGYNDTWSKWSKLNRAVYTNLSEGNYTFRAKAMNIYGQISEEADYSFAILPPWYRTIWAIIGYIIAAILVIVVSVKIYTRKLEEDKKRLEGIVKERTAEVVSQKIEIEHKNKEITDSIHYAKRIQEALLPVKNQIDVPNLELFVFFRPKDIVSGDFYFIRQIPTSSTLIATAADCTGHGVPGAFMSMLGISFLNELIAKQEILHSDEILNLLRLQVIASLNPKGLHFETKDGMDISLIVYNYKTNLLEFSGANNPLYHFRNGELNEVKADKMPVGLHERCKEPFHRQEIKPEPGDIVYLFSDGFIDQFGGEHGKKYLSKNFKEFLLNIHQKPIQEQEKLIAAESTNWRGQIDQIDDQVVMGIRFL